MTEGWRAGFPGGNPCFGFPAFSGGLQLALQCYCYGHVHWCRMRCTPQLFCRVPPKTSHNPLLPTIVQPKEPSHPKKIIPSPKIFHLPLFTAGRENMPLCGVFPAWWGWNMSWAKSTFTSPALPNAVCLNGCFQRTMKNVYGIFCYFFFSNWICCREPSHCLPLLLI